MSIGNPPNETCCAKVYQLLMIPNRQNIVQALESYMEKTGTKLAKISRDSKVSYDTIRDVYRGKSLSMRAEDWEKLKYVILDNEASVPLLGQVPAGKPLDCIEEIKPEKNIVYPSAMPDWFALRVAGESMNLVARHGSFIIVNPHNKNATELDGKFIVANVNNEFTFKRLRLNPPRLEPVSSIPHETIYLQSEQECEIVGHVVGQVDDLSEG